MLQVLDLVMPKAQEIKLWDTGKQADRLGNMIGGAIFRYNHAQLSVRVCLHFGQDGKDGML